MSEYHDEDGFTCHALVGGTVPMRIDTRYHALLALKRRTKQDISNEECMAELKSFFEKPVMTGVLERTPITHFAAIYDEESHLCYFTRINKKSIFVGTVLKKREDKILVHPDDERFIIRKNGSLAHVKSETDGGIFVCVSVLDEKTFLSVSKSHTFSKGDFKWKTRFGTQSKALTRTIL